MLYDGVCGLCDRLVQFVLRRDRYDRFRFAATPATTSCGAGSFAPFTRGRPGLPWRRGGGGA